MAVGIGIVGASPTAGWGFRAHVPALHALAASGEDVRIAGVSTTRRESAEEAARLTGATPYTDSRELAADPDVDLLVVTVKVPGHREAVAAGLERGVDVLSEWPLALDADEARDMQALAAAHGRRVFVGVQARFDPAAVAVRETVGRGDLGTLQAIAVRSARVKDPNDVAPRRVYTMDRASGAGNREVHAGHVLDLVNELTGGVDVLAGGARVAQRHTRTTEGEEIRVTAPDTLHGLISTATALGTLLVWDSKVRPSTEIVLDGDRGRATIRSGRGSGLESQVQIEALSAEIEYADGERTVIEPTDDPDNPQGANVAALYRAVLADRRDGGHRAADAADAIELHAAIERLAA